MHLSCCVVGGSAEGAVNRAGKLSALVVSSPVICLFLLVYLVTTKVITIVLSIKQFPKKKKNGIYCFSPFSICTSRSALWPTLLYPTDISNLIVLYVKCILSG